ncbi:MAG: preprotein translocase subunit SecE [Elusimicrobiota bacterium]|nr:preprotein translocase subunit SecE [Elusimicrobiota bacterium]
MKYLNQLVAFLKEVYSELRKVSWLSKKEVLASTIVVIIFVLIVAIFIGLVDFILAKILAMFLGG